MVTQLFLINPELIWPDPNSYYYPHLFWHVQIFLPDPRLFLQAAQLFFQAPNFSNQSLTVMTSPQLFCPTPIISDQPQLLWPASTVLTNYLTVLTSQLFWRPLAVLTSPQLLRPSPNHSDQPQTVLHSPPPLSKRWTSFYPVYDVYQRCIFE
jgi:hypothetical protein